ncbi:MAG: hypothetical protein NVSMB2_12400 [Chloroflexota bacterium]
MTRRVITFARDTRAVTARTQPAKAKASSSGGLHGLTAAWCVAVVVLPFAGAATAPSGWLTGLFALLGMTLIAPLLGSGAPWAVLCGLCGALLLLAPRDQLGAGTPALVIAAVMCAMLWLTNRTDSRDGRDHGRPAVGSFARAQQVRQGAAGEQFVTTQLTRELPENFVLIAGLQLSRGAGDIDQLIVGPTGVFVLETKTMAGSIVCDDDGVWRRTRSGPGGQTFPAFIGDPVVQVQRNIFAVRQTLQPRLPQLFGTSGLWIEGLVVFAHPRSVLQANASRVPAVLVSDLLPRICSHQPRRGLEASEIEDVVRVLVDAHGQRTTTRGVQTQSAQALVEFALALPIVLSLVWVTVALSRIITAEVGLIGLAHDVARAGALAKTPSDAATRMRERVQIAAPGLGIDPSTAELEYDVSMFADPDRPRVVAAVRCRVDFGSVPLIGAIETPSLRAEHVEWVDPFRSGLAVMP